jgi:hypothetical protein
MLWRAAPSVRRAGYIAKNLALVKSFHAVKDGGLRHQKPAFDRIEDHTVWRLY